MNINLNYKIPGLILLAHLVVNIYMAYNDIGNDNIFFTSWATWGIIALFFFILFFLDRRKQSVESNTKESPRFANIIFSLFLSVGNIMAYFVLLPYFAPDNIDGFGFAAFLMIILFPATLIGGTIVYYKILRSNAPSRLIRIVVCFISVLLIMIMIPKLFLG